MKQTRLYIFIFILIVISVCAVLLLTSTGPKKVSPGPVGEDGVLLVNCCRKTVATVGGDGYTEYSLYQNADGSCEVWFHSAYENEPEMRSSRKTEQKTVDDVYAQISRYGMREWENKDCTVGPDGVICSVSFRIEDGSYIRVSSDKMPENGMRAMNEVTSVLAACMADNDPQ